MVEEEREDSRANGAAHDDARRTPPAALPAILVRVGKEQAHDEAHQRKEHHRVPRNRKVLLVVVERQKRGVDELRQTRRGTHGRGRHRAIQQRARRDGREHHNHVSVAHHHVVKLRGHHGDARYGQRRDARNARAARGMRQQSMPPHEACEQRLSTFIGHGQAPFKGKQPINDTPEKRISTQKQPQPYACRSMQNVTPSPSPYSLNRLKPMCS